MDQALILASELKKREALSNVINCYVWVHFTRDPKNKLRRGINQKEVADFMGLTINTTFCQIMNECMTKMGYKPREIRGNYYYKNIKRIA